MVRWLLVTAFCVVSSWSGPASAEVVDFTCTTSAGCKYDEQLGKSITKEFRGYCNTSGIKVQPYTQQCNSGNANVTCTVADCDGPLAYCTCSCTNWSPTGRHPAAIWVYC